MSDQPAQADPAKSRSISFRLSRWADIKAVAKDSFSGNPSAYLNALVASDIGRDAQGKPYSKSESLTCPVISDESFIAQLRRVLVREDVREEVVGLLAEAASRVSQSKQSSSTRGKADGRSRV